MERKKLVVYAMTLVALGYAALKVVLAGRWIFDGAELWTEAYLPLAGDSYGHLLGAKWIGTRNLGHGLAIFAGLVMRRPAWLTALLGMGVLIELLDGFWLAYGKFAVGFSGPHTDFYMFGAFALVVVLIPATLAYDRAAAERGR